MASALSSGFKTMTEAPSLVMSPVSGRRLVTMTSAVLLAGSNGRTCAESFASSSKRSTFLFAVMLR
jgi:hypothetical protein